MENFDILIMIFSSCSKNNFKNYMKMHVKQPNGLILSRKDNLFIMNDNDAIINRRIHKVSINVICSTSYTMVYRTRDILYRYPY